MLSRSQDTSSRSGSISIIKHLLTKFTPRKLWIRVNQIDPTNVYISLLGTWNIFKWSIVFCSKFIEAVRQLALQALSNGAKVKAKDQHHCRSYCRYVATTCRRTPVKLGRIKAIAETRVLLSECSLWQIRAYLLSANCLKGSLFLLGYFFKHYLQWQLAIWT